MIADADTMGVLPEVSKDLVVVAEGGLAVDDPANAKEFVEQALEALGVGEGGGGPIEAEPSVAVSAPKRIDELSAKEGAEGSDGKEVVQRSGNPSIGVGIEASSGDDAVDMGMKAQVASPGVQDGGDAEIGAEVARIASEFLEGGGGAGEERVEDEVSIGEGESPELPRESEDDMKGVGGEHASHALLDPVPDVNYIHPSATITSPHPSLL